ncbi:MAG: 50S ribosomal protein L25 [Deinococcota bacterium]
MKLVATQRNAGKANQLRHGGQLPGIVYNKQVNIPVSVELRAFDKVFRTQGTSHVIELDVDGSSHDVLVKQVQMDKRRRLPLHVDFYEVTAGEQVEVGVAIDFVGTPAAVKEGAQIDVQRRDVTIKIVPRLIPDKLEVDISHLGFGDSMHVSDIVGLLPEEAEVMDDTELTLVAVVAPRVVEETEDEADGEMTEPEVIGASDDDDEAGDDEG